MPVAATDFFDRAAGAGAVQALAAHAKLEAVAEPGAALAGQDPTVGRLREGALRLRNPSLRIVAGGDRAALGCPADADFVGGSDGARGEEEGGDENGENRAEPHLPGR